MTIRVTTSLLPSFAKGPICLCVPFHFCHLMVFITGQSQILVKPVPPELLTLKLYTGKAYEFVMIPERK